MKEQNIILIGYMGSGKTTLGKKLAKALQFDFVDTDKQIELTFNTTIQTLFETIGEQKFRTLEKLFIESFNENNTVLATGGGMPCYNQNIDKLKKLGTVIYLERPAKELANRLSHSKTKRPLLENKTNKELITFVENQLSEREFYYKQAHILLNRDQQEIEYILKKIDEHTN